MKSLKILFSMAVLSTLVACSSTPEKGVADIDAMTDTAPGLNGIEVMSAQGKRIDSLDANGNSYSPEELERMRMMELSGGMKPVVYFGLNQFTLDTDNTAVVKHYAQTLMANPKRRVSLEGHTDERGSPEYNLALGERRAKAVSQAMMLFGVQQNRIDVISYGEMQPATTENNEAAWQLNRRVDIMIR